MGLGSLNPIKNLVDIVTAPVRWAKDAIDHPGHVADRNAKSAQDRELENWYLQQEYNTPANQVQRLKDAGLNMNLAYGNVNTGNATSAPKTYTAEEDGNYLMNLATGVIGHSFNALQLLNGLQASKASQANQIAQVQHQKDVLDFQRNQAAINNAFRQQEMAYRQSRTEQDYQNWNAEFDERVRHNKAMEGKPTTMSLLNSAVYGLTGKNATDVATEAGRLEKKYLMHAFPFSPKRVGDVMSRVAGEYYKWKYRK